MTEAARASETSVNFYQSTRRYNPEDSHLRTHHRENLGSYSDHTNTHQQPALTSQIRYGKKTLNANSTKTASFKI
jgi:hypothetical protein